MSKIKKNLIKNWKKITLILVILIFVYLFVSNNKKEDVKSVQIKKGEISEEMTLSGEVNAVNYAKLSFETAGKIVYVGVREGEAVKKGRLISKLDTTVLNSSYQIALSNLRAAEAALSNVYDQVKDHSADETYAQKDTRTAAESAKDKAFEAVVAAKRNLDGASLYAPFDGLVVFLNHPFSGVYASLGSVEAEIIDPRTVYFETSADQNEVIKITEGMEAEIVLDPFSQTSFKGIVKNISYTPKQNELGSVYSIKVDFNQGQDLSRLKIAMTGEAKFTISTKSESFYLPIGFVKQDKDGKFLKLDPKGKNKLRVKEGIESENYIEIMAEEGLDESLVVYD